MRRLWRRLLDMIPPGEPSVAQVIRDPKAYDRYLWERSEFYREKRERPLRGSLPELREWDQ